LTRDTKPVKIAVFSAGFGRNDLEPVVVSRYPQVAVALQWLAGEAPGARMSGSGASVFASFESEAEAARIAAKAPGSVRAVVAKGLEVHPLAA
jgi:4-diphosphocytidyl-2-C-methyl-D-erythritol kinase